VFAESDVDVVAIRTGGPGGQHRNKASTAVRATHRPSGIVVVADGERQFGLNRGAALRMLRERLERADREAGRRLTSARWQVHDDLVRGDPVRVERP
jgi:peptide chain release factor